MNRQTFYILLVLVACLSIAFAGPDNKDTDNKDNGGKDKETIVESTPKGAADIFSTLGALTTAAVLYML